MQFFTATICLQVPIGLSNGVSFVWRGIKTRLFLEIIIIIVVHVNETSHSFPFQMVKASENVPVTPTTGAAAVGSPTGYASSPANLSARWAKLRADPALQRSAALRARLARRERKNRQRILRLQEFHRLRSMVPAIAQTPNVDKVSLIPRARILRVPAILLSVSDSRQNVWA